MINTKEIKVGSRIWFAEEKKPYKVRAFNDRFIVCTKPANLHKTYYYTVVDLERDIRGTETIGWCRDFEQDEDCWDSIADLAKGEAEISRRNNIPLYVVRVDI